MDNRKINVYSEIGDLKTVVLHRPGVEIENLIPEYLERLLFDDIPFLKVARQEHDNFAKILQDNGVETLYLEDLVVESLWQPEVKQSFLNEVIQESEIYEAQTITSLKKYLCSMPEKEMIDKIMAGIRKKEVQIVEHYEDYPFIMDPMPNLYFTRDPFASIGDGISLNSMKTKTRRRETIFGKYIFKYHPKFKISGSKFWCCRDDVNNIEGGDELILSKEVIAIGNSARTDKDAIINMAKTIFEKCGTFKIILIFDIPKIRAFMHLDTVFTMIDYDKFTVHPGIEGTLEVSAITYNYKLRELVIKEEVGSLQKILSKYLKKDITLLHCGGGDKIISGREQWNDGSNTLAISPGTVITYERNYVTNEILDKNNVLVIPIPSGELSRGRGGPRCMSMPLYRKDLLKT